MVDRRVCQWIAKEDSEGPFDSKAKSWMIAATTSRYVIDREERSLFDILSRTANSIAKCVTGESRDPEIPSLLQPGTVDASIGRGVQRVEADLMRDPAMYFALGKAMG